MLTAVLLAALPSLLQSAPPPIGPTLELEGPERLTDAGGALTAVVRITNPGPAPIVLRSLGAHRFAAPDFARLERMKAPVPDFSVWRNVLGPGQSTRVRLGQGRLGPGTHALQAALSWRPAAAADGVREVSDAPGSERVIHSSWVQGQPGPFLVAPAPGAGAWHTTEGRWSRTVTADPVIAALTEAATVEGFVPNLPVLGHVAFRDGVAHTVEGSALVRRLNASRPALQALAAGLAGGAVRVRADFDDRALKTAFAVTPEPNLPYASAKVTPWQSTPTWYALEVTPATLPAFWQQAAASGARLAHDDYYGVLLIRGGLAPTPGIPLP
jgi:hypothetical protein